MDYKEKLKLAKEALESGSYDKDTIEYIFPELSESEDEKMRKIISDILLIDSDEIREILDANNVLMQDIDAWLEKQDSQDNAEDVDILHRFSFYSYKDEPNVLYLSGFYVNEEYRNKGIGTKILEVADEVAKSLDCYAIRLKTKKDSDAERLYRTHGYNSLATEDKDEIWLEKQTEQKPADKVEPKFEVGDWVIDKQGIVHQIANIIENVTYHTYGYDLVDGGYFVDNTEGVRLWTIQDAKDGDVLYTSSTASNEVFIFKGLSIEGYIECYCSYDSEDKYCEGKFHFIGKPTFKIHPATKEQCDLLFKKMNEAGFEWNSEEKELKKVVTPIFNIGDTIAKKHNFDIHDFGSFTITDITGGKYWYNDRIICDITEQDDWEIYEPIRQNSSVWSENNSCYYDDICEILINLINSPKSNVNKDAVQKDLDWLMSIKELLLKYSWSEEDIEMINWLIRCCEKEHEELCNDRYGHQEIVSDLKRDCRKKWDWFESLKNKVVPRNRWKPSDKQITCLHDAVARYNREGFSATILTSLLEQLKKLKEE